MKLETLMLKFKYYDNTCKKYIIVKVLKTFFSIHKIHNTFDNNVRPHYKGLGLVIQYVGK
jgi:hypothetical protein